MVGIIKNILNKVGIFVFFVISSFGLSAQVKNKAKIEPFIKKISEIDSSLVRESVYLHTGKSFFITGETLWFSAFVTDYAGQPVTYNRNLYVDILNPEGEIVFQKLLYINHRGMSAGFFELGDSIAGGDYYLRAYTSSQRNFDENYFYTKQINIFNPKIPHFTPEYLKVLRKQRRQKKRIQLSYNFNGNVLLANTENTLTLRVTNKLGFPEQADIVIENLINKQKTQLKTDKNGFASETFFVETQSKYKVTAYGQSKKIKVTTKSALSNAIKIEKITTENGYFNIRVVNKLRKTNDSLARTFSVIYRIPGETVESKTFFIGNSEETTIQLVKHEDKGGLLHFVLLDYTGNILSEYSFFSKLKSPEIKLNYETENDSVFVRLSNQNLDRISAFVYSNEPQKTENNNSDIKHYFLLNNRVGSFLNYNETGSQMSLYSDKANLLNSFNILRKELTTYFPPKNRISLSGTLYLSVLDLPAKNKQVELSVLNKHFDIFVQNTDKNGRFLFDSLNYMDTIRLKFNARNLRGKNAFVIDIDEDTTPDFKPFYTDENISEKIKYIKNGRSDYLINKNKTTNERTNNSSEKIHSHADMIIYFDEINTTAYHSTLQIISNYVPGIRTGGMSTMRGVTSLTQSSEPFYLINGVPVDKRAVDDLPPNDVDRVEILKSGANTAIYGSRGGNGVIAVFTKKGFFTNLGKLDLKILGYAQMKPFSISENLNSESPQTIYFSPNVKASDSGDFVFSFLKPKNHESMILDIQGFTKTGKPVSIIKKLR